MKLLSLLLLISTSIFAEDKVIIQSLDKNLDLTDLEKNYDVRNGLPRQHETRKQIPASQLIGKIFKDAGLETETKSLDQLDKDFLFRKAESYSLEDLSKNYPQINSEKLKKLQALIKASK